MKKGNYRGIYSLFLFLFILNSSCATKELEEEEKPTVYIKETDGKYELIRHGKPFYIKGGAAHKDYLEDLKEAGGNTARIYDTTDLQTVLDRAKELSLAVVVDIPLPKFDRDPEYYEDQILFDTIFERVKRTVTTYRNHPALLYWNLGNEIYYPYLYQRTNFYNNYNSLIDLIHETDPNHPVSTSTIGANKLEVLSIITRSPKLDFISFNSFGVISSFKKRLLPIKPLWNGPSVITEWGVNGVWESDHTIWGAPIEETSTKKAEQIKQRNQNYIEPLKEMNSLGSFVFYWGHKVEFTPTWYSLFTENGLKSQAVFELSQIWKNKTISNNFPGPRIQYLLLNGRGAKESILLNSGEEAKASALIPDGLYEELQFSWKITSESWYSVHESESLEIEFKKDGPDVTFFAPKEEGPYRIHLLLKNGTDYFASANIPFYVLAPTNEE